jgi:hypothetical protein
LLAYDQIMWTDRDEVERRIHALVADFLDAREAAADRELDLGVFAIVAEIRERRTPEEIEDVVEQRKRPEAGYTPEAEWTPSMWYRCSDLRDWIASGLFRRAMQIADGEYDEYFDDEPA